MSAKVPLTFMPDNKTIQVRVGISVLEAARRAGVPIRTRCDGKAACLMCKVTTDGQGLSLIQPMEQRKLAGLDAEGARLACQARVNGPAVVTVPEDPLRAAVRKQLQRQEEEPLW
ncbi:2Fe-2S iron-sulfur cluster-binding protein [Paenibacillus methanolicus]|uniref:2Fe-2S iron-sulfur cluster protein n=1 Tax=Paenibacillus methanolicus TaxID=582686 RepID=A0A5S5CID7_9BACL|nr:2Fe-2S iron-sulfur cluster-binding protein [Paenibacillus methanolicus]TYP77773.1 2Fe-2S iron-sulfur cluster protein [Paenibacillus methanolicus]